MHDLIGSLIKEDNMRPKSLVTAVFIIILFGMIGVTSWASVVQPVWQWQGLVRAPDNAWTIATLCDAYAGFITFYVFVCLRERTLIKRVFWALAIISLGNMAMASYSLWAISRLKPNQPLSDVFKGHTV
jgi:hypothetical protein